MQPLVTEDIHGPESETSLQTVLKSPAAVAIFSPISEQKEPSSIRALQVFPGHPRLGAEQAASEEGQCIHQAGQAAARGGEGMLGQNSDPREQTHNQKGGYLKLLKSNHFATCSG